MIPAKPGRGCTVGFDELRQAGLLRKPTSEDAKRIPTEREQSLAIHARRVAKMQADPRTVAANEKFAAMRAEREADQQAQRDALEQRQRERAEQQLEAERLRARAGWLANGGDAEGFEAAWPGMRDDILRERALGNGDKARANQLQAAQRAL